MDRTNNYNDLKPFRFWCQKVLPLVYDDSLSYYELLDKVIDYLNKTMEDVTVLNDDTEALYTAYNQLQSYVNNYFDNLDVQDEINAKLDQMAIDGTLSSLINPQIPGAVSAWLAANVDPVGSAVIVDATLSIAGAAADAKVTGDNITYLKNAISGIQEGEMDGFRHVSNWVNGNFAGTTLISGNTRIRPENFIYVKSGDIITINNGTHYDHAVSIRRGTMENNTIVRNDTSWQSQNEQIKINNDGFFIVIFADSTNKSEVLNPAQFDGSVTISSYSMRNIISIDSHLANIDILTEGYKYVKIPLLPTIDYTNSSIQANIPSGSNIKLKYYAYSGSDFTRFVFGGIKSDNTTVSLYSLYNNTDTEIDITTSENYIGLYMQLVRSTPSETATEYSVLIKGDWGDTLGHDIVNLKNDSINNTNKIDLLNVQFNECVNSYFNLFDLATLTDGYVYNASGQPVSVSGCTIASKLPIEQGKTYYVKKVRCYFSYIIYNDGTSVRVDDSDSIRAKSFTASKDGYIYLTFNTVDTGKQIFTESQTLYNSDYDGTYYTPNKLIIPAGVSYSCVVSKSGNGDFTNLVDAIAEAITHPDAFVYVKPGTYDILSEYGISYMESHTFSANDRGIELNNGIHLIFDMGAFVTCNYTGDNATVNEFFSPFNISGSCIIENLNLVAKNCRYAVHDENGGNITPYHVHWKRCYLEFDNSQNTHWSSKKVIGGGLGKYADILIEDCIFNPVNIDAAGITNGCVTYHNNAAADSISNVVIRGCYFVKSTFSIRWYGNSTLITKCLCENNSFTAQPYSAAETQQSENVNVVMYSWNNEIRT